MEGHPPFAPPMPAKTLTTLLAVATCSLSAAAVFSSPSVALGSGEVRARITVESPRSTNGQLKRPTSRRARPPSVSKPLPFARDSVWNARLPDNAPLDAMSGVYVGRLQELLKRWSPYVNTTRFSTPIYTVPANQPRVRVTMHVRGQGFGDAFEGVPIPPQARPAAGSDGHLVISQPSTDTMWEMWRASRQPDGWHAAYGGRINNMSRNPGYYVDNPRWGATATSLPLLGGLMRIDELAAGRIDHALALALPEIRQTAYSWPAQRSDGSSLDPSSIPDGARFRIDPKLDLRRLKMSPVVRAMAEAAQRHGIVVRDGAGAVAFYAEDPTPTGKNPYTGKHGLFGGRYITTALRNEFPWQHLQVLRTQISLDPR